MDPIYLTHPDPSIRGAGGEIPCPFANSDDRDPNDATDCAGYWIGFETRVGKVHIPWFKYNRADPYEWSAEDGCTYYVCEQCDQQLQRLLMSQDDFIIQEATNLTLIST